MAECIFCKIVRGEIPCAKLYEDDMVLSFLDINPINHGHALVMPKKHYATLLDIPDEDLTACMTVAKRVARALTGGMGAEGLNLLQNNGRVAGQLIDHIHFHLIPRSAGDGFLSSWPAKPYPDGELSKVLTRVKEDL
jgi:histidine triad (HIT) family protein